MMSNTNQTLPKLAAKIVSFIWHPVFVPLYTVLIYFYLTDRYFLPQNINFLIYYLLIVAIIIPLLFFGVMFYTKSFSGIQLEKPRERLFFSVIMAVVYFIIFQKLTHYRQFVELYPFLLGVFLSILALSVYNFFNQKPSIHAMAVSGSITFLIIWSYYTHIEILNYLAILIMLAALVMAARLYLQAHSLKDIARGSFIGILMQLVAFYIIWLYY